jgi:cytochrome c oxidase subunit 2
MFNVGTTTVEAVDNVLVFIVVISVALLLLITGLMIYFAFKYNHKRHPEPKPVKQHLWIEVVWTAIPTVLVLMMFWYGYDGFKLLREVPEDAMDVHVTGRMWDWSFEYENGKRSTELIVPVNKPVKALLKSIDVVHSFYIPAFRVKEDVVPGLETYLWFQPDEVGQVDIFCAEFCGQRHSYMRSVVKILPQDEFDKWYHAEEKKEETGPDPALAIMEEAGCFDCHNLGQTQEDMLSLKGLIGTKRIVLVNDVEKEITIDEDYIRRSIKDPRAEVVKGQDGNAMEVPDDLTTEQIETIVRFLKTQKADKISSTEETRGDSTTVEATDSNNSDQGEAVQGNSVAEGENSGAEKGSEKVDNK